MADVRYLRRAPGAPVAEYVAVLHGRDAVGIRLSLTEAQLADCRIRCQALQDADRIHSWEIVPARSLSVRELNVFVRKVLTFEPGEPLKGA